MEASGADKGFFQKPPVLQNQFHDDATYQRCFKRETIPYSCFLDANVASLSSAAHRASG